MARRQPYNPATAIHDRRASDASRGIVGHMAAIEIDDPFEAGAKIIAMRSTRNDPLAGMHARRFIDEAQYQGGRAFQDDWERAERGPRAIDPSKEAVDGGRAPEPLTEAQQKSFKRLADVHAALGLNGSAIVHDVLIHGLAISDLVTRRGYQGEHWRKYFGRRFNECLDCLAVVYGFASARNGARA